MHAVICGAQSQTQSTSASLNFSLIQLTRSIVDKINENSNLKFPCEFTIKIFGLASDAFEMEVITIVRKHIKFLREDALSSRYSKDKKYLALSISFTANSREELDNLYRELSRSPHVLMAL
ncbi:MAG: DUF493 domain-containing protein [Gammaproteobacteria bacterium]|nr:DUF493 domain-containing protein [Gammaproteobacteria bacterium]